MYRLGSTLEIAQRDQKGIHLVHSIDKWRVIVSAVVEETVASALVADQQTGITLCFHFLSE